jgi:hypothetical protein
LFLHINGFIVRIIVQVLLGIHHDVPLREHRKVFLVNGHGVLAGPDILDEVRAVFLVTAVYLPISMLAPSMGTPFTLS